MGFEGKRSSSSDGLRPLPREDTPLLGSYQEQQPLSSQPKAFANIFIAIVGAGVLGLPYTFMKCGWITSLLTICAVATLTCYCMMLLVRTRRKLESCNSFLSISCSSCDIIKINSFGDVGFAVCGPIGRFAVDVMIVLTQGGFCVGYLIFIGQTLANLYNNNNSPSPSPIAANANLRMPPKLWGIAAKSIYIWACFPFQLGLNAIPTLTHLAPLSIFADVVDVGAMGLVMAEDVSTFIKQTSVSIEAFGNLSTFFYGLGVAVFSFEGVGMALPLESEMKDRSKFGKLLALSMFLIAVLYGSFGILGYLAFGENTQDIVTANMGRGLLSTLIQLGLCVNLFLTYPLMMHPVYEVIERRFWEGKYCLWMRWALVLGVSLVALFVPNFADFLSLVGSSLCCVLGFVLPALFHYVVFKEEMEWKGALTDMGIIVLGVLLGVMGTWSSLSEIFSVKA